MQTINFWNKLHLYRHKVILGFVFLFLSFSAFGQGDYQNRKIIHNPNYDNKKISFGFLIGLHQSTYKLRYSDDFVLNEFDTVHSIIPQRNMGFSLGFIVNLSLHDYFDLRFMPKVAFYEHNLEYNFTNANSQTHLKESTVVEFPLLLKYKSKRRGNSRMYLISGIKPGLEASAKSKIANEEQLIPINKFNFSVDFGFGFDLYYPLFKFSPELRFSKGIPNMLGNEVNEYSQGIDRLTTNTVTLYLLFQ